MVSFVEMIITAFTTRNSNVHRHRESFPEGFQLNYKNKGKKIEAAEKEDMEIAKLVICFTVSFVFPDKSVFFNCCCIQIR